MTSEADRLLKKALKLLSYRPRSVKEITRRLKLISDDLSQIEAAIHQLIKLELLNDHQFTSWWVDQRCRFRPRGNIALKQELKQKGISLDIIEQYLLSPDKELNLAVRLLKARSVPHQQAFTYLKTKGFTTSIISQSIDELYLKG